jgi:micrococcal nuclease
MYEYRATLKKVVDGDTVDVELSLGFDIYQSHRLRLYGVNTPELHDRDATIRAKALEAKQFLIDTLPTAAGAITVRSHKDAGDKYGRYLAELFLPEQEVSVNQQLVARGLAVPFMTDG